MRGTTPDESELVARLRRSDPAALEHLFEWHHHGLFRYVAGLIGPGDAADIVQDVFLRIWQDREDLLVRASLKALLYTMARNRALNVRRKLSRVRLTGHLPDVAGPGGDEASHLTRIVASALEKLPPRRAEAFLLSRYHDLSHEQVARIMGLSIRTVQTHIVHALRDIRKALADSELVRTTP